MNHTRKVRGFVGAWRGKAREDLFIEAWTNVPNPPSWFVSVRRAIWQEDRGGVDAFMQTVEGAEIPIQIKGGYHAALEYWKRMKSQGKDAAIVILRAYMSHEEVRHLTLLSIGVYKERQKTAD